VQTNTVKIKSLINQIGKILLKYVSILVLVLNYSFLFDKQNYITQTKSAEKLKISAYPFTFPGGEGGPRKRWMRGSVGDILYAPDKISSFKNIFPEKFTQPY
jgi:hypothetical protein